VPVSGGERTPEAAPGRLFIESFDNFAFDEVLRETTLDVHNRLMVQLAAIITCQALREYRVMLGAALAGIDLPTRELLTLSMLVALGGCDAQVKGHVAGNLKAGNDRTRMIGVLTQLLPFIGYPRTLNGLRAVDEVTAS